MVSTPLNQLLVIDIETACSHPSYADLPETWKTLWEEKVSRNLPEGINADEWYGARAGVMAEFARVVCVSMAIFTGSAEKPGLKLRSVSNADEKQLLTELVSVLENLKNAGRNFCFAGHNIREFDIPFLCRRMIIHGITIPSCMDFQNKKPWEVNMVDTFQYWRFGDFKNFTSLKLLAAALSLPSPKDDLDGSMVSPLFWERDPAIQQQNLERIVAYCEKDVLTTANIIMRFRNESPIELENVEGQTVTGA